jgi:hypothetical protein
MLELAHGKMCWVPYSSPLEVKGKKIICADDRAKPIFDRCIDDLKRASHWYTPVEDVQLNIDLCMRAKGWSRVVSEGYMVNGQ